MVWYWSHLRQSGFDKPTSALDGTSTRKTSSVPMLSVLYIRAARTRLVDSFGMEVHCIGEGVE